MLEARAVTVRWDDADAPNEAGRDMGYALEGATCHIEPGELVAFIGANGSGKSTLARLLCAAQLPSEGAVLVDGVTSGKPADRARIRRLVGRVGQSPSDQVISTVVADEVAFGLENLGLDEDEVRARSKRALEAVRLAGFEHRLVEELSGGEQQRLAMASVLAMEPAYLVLDEPTAHLDSAVRPDFRALIRRCARHGAGVALVTHDPLEALMCDRIYCLSQGRIVWEASPQELLSEGDVRLETVVPGAAYVEMLRQAVRRGFDVRSGIEPAEVARWLEGELCAGRLDAEDVRALARAARSGDALRGGGAPEAEGEPSRTPCGEAQGIRLRNVRATRSGAEILHGVSFSVSPGEVVLLAGPSGAGKTTLASIVGGIASLDAGTVRIDGAEPAPGMAGIAFQDPESQLFLETVAEELAFAPRNLGFDDDRVAAATKGAAARLGIEDILQHDPFALSGGQARRVALASVLTSEPRALVLDEPTAGLDKHGREALHRLVREIAAAGSPVLVISHDLEEWMAIADRVVLMARGCVAWEGASRALACDIEAFSRCGMKPPEALSFARACDALVEASAQGAAEKSALVADTGSVVLRQDEVRCEVPRARLDARVKLLLLLAATVALFACGAPWTLPIWLVCAVGVARSAGVTAREAGRVVKPMLILFTVVTIANLISLDGSADIMIAPPFGLSTTGALRSGWAIARIVILLCFALSVSASTAPTQLADGFVRLMAPVARFGVPVGDIGLALSMALRFIPLVASEADRIRRAQMSRGVDFDGGGVLRRVHAWISVIIPLVVGLFRRADRIAESMDARCFEPGARRARPRPLAPRDLCVLAAGLCGMVVLVACSYLI